MERGAGQNTLLKWVKYARRRGGGKFWSKNGCITRDGIYEQPLTKPNSNHHDTSLGQDELYNAALERFFFSILGCLTPFGNNVTINGSQGT